MAAGVAPGMLLAVADVGTGVWRGIAAVAGLVLALVGMFAGLGAWWVLEARWRERTGRRLFNDSARVVIDAEGLRVDGLGHSSWSEVLSYEGIPDSESTLVVYTSRYGGLLLEAPADDLLAVIDHYLERTRQGHIPGATTAGAGLHFKAMVFHYPTFLAWIAAGYGLALLVAGFVVYQTEVGPLKTGVLLIIGVPAIAWLVWTIPFWQMSAFGASRVVAFSLAGKELRSADGKWMIDVQAVPGKRICSRGIGYAIEFISFAPKKGRRLDLVVDERDMETLLDQLRAGGGFDFSSRDREQVRQGFSRPAMTAERQCLARP